MGSGNAVILCLRVALFCRFLPSSKNYDSIERKKMGDMYRDRNNTSKLKHVSIRRNVFFRC